MKKIAMAGNSDHEGPSDAGGAASAAGAVENVGEGIGTDADTEVLTGSVAAVEVAVDVLEETLAPSHWERAICGRLHLVIALPGNSVGGPEVAEAVELVERESAGPEEPVGAAAGASTATSEEGLMEGSSHQAEDPGSVAAEVGDSVEREPAETEETVERAGGKVPVSHLVEFLLSNLVDGPRVAEAGEVEDREPTGPEAPVGGDAVASAPVEGPAGAEVSWTSEVAGEVEVSVG